MASNTVNLTVTAPAAPALSVVKTADETPVAVGATVHLHVQVTNTGNVALTSVTIAEANAVSCQLPLGGAVRGVGRHGSHRRRASRGQLLRLRARSHRRPCRRVLRDPTTGTASGTVTETGTGDNLPNVFVVAINTNGAVATTTASNGTYTLGGLPAGSIRIRYIDLTAAHTDEYHITSPDYAGATPLATPSPSPPAAPPPDSPPPSPHPLNRPTGAPGGLSSGVELVNDDAMKRTNSVGGGRALRRSPRRSPRGHPRSPRTRAIGRPRRAPRRSPSGSPAPRSGHPRSRGPLW